MAKRKKNKGTNIDLQDTTQTTKYQATSILGEGWGEGGGV